MRYLSIIFIFLPCVSCDSQQVSETPEAEAALISRASFIEVGERVQVIEGGADLYNRPDGLIVDFAPAGSAGTIKHWQSKRGIIWVRVNFDDLFEGSSLLGELLKPENGSSPDPPPPPSAGTIVLGGAGCSMARDLFQAGIMYPEEYDFTIWPKEADGQKITRSWSGGALDTWGQPGVNGYSLKWNSFFNGINYASPTVLLFMVCLNGIEPGTPVTQTHIDQVTHVLSRFQSSSNAAVYITGQPRYTSGHVCSIAGAGGPDFSHDVATEAAAAGGFGYVDLGIEYTPEQVYKDGCHLATRDGQAYAAGRLNEWLNGLDK